MTHYDLLRRCGFDDRQARALLASGLTVVDFLPFGWSK